MKKLNKRFESTENTIEAFGIVPFAVCACDPVCKCSCQTDASKSVTTKNNALNSDYAASAKVYAW